jgi:hypothetical protein
MRTDSKPSISRRHSSCYFMQMLRFLTLHCPGITEHAERERQRHQPAHPSFQMYTGSRLCHFPIMLSCRRAGPTDGALYVGLHSAPGQGR